jgi:hypothetical protein
VEFGAAFKAIIAPHDEKYNPTERPFKAKRVAEESERTSVESRAVPLPTASMSKEELSAKGNVTVVLGGQPNFEMLIHDGSMFLYGLADGVVSDRVALCGFGDYKFVLGGDASKYLTDNDSLSWEFKIEDAEKFTSVFCLADGHSLKEPCPAEPMTLHAFMTFLERNEQVGVSIANHKIERKKSEKSEGGEAWMYEVKPEGDCVGVIVQKFTGKKVKPTWANIAAMLSAKKVKESAHTKVFIKMT